MENARFDALARSLVGSASRRGLLAGLLGLGAGLVRIGGAGAACPPEQVAAAGGRCVCRTTGRPPAAGVCPCSSGQERCGGVCRAASTFQGDPANCGSCGVSCNDGDLCTTDACVAGVCQHAPLTGSGDCTLAVTFSPTDDPNYCTVVVQLQDFAPTTSYIATLYADQFQFQAGQFTVTTDGAGNAKVNWFSYGKGHTLRARICGISSDLVEVAC